jgi:hypothetical protein
MLYLRVINPTEEVIEMTEVVDRFRIAVGVADCFRMTALWRDKKAEEYPDDPRNAQSAAALRELAEYVESISDDPRVRFLAAQRQHSADGITVGVAAQNLIARFGFDGPRVRYEAFLSELCIQVAYDVLELVTEEMLSPEEATERYSVYFRDAGQALTDGYYLHELADYGDPEFLRELCLPKAAAV